MFFGLASAWGFLSGITGFAMALSILGQPIGIEKPVLWFVLLPSLATAVFGGVVASIAYREARRRIK